MDTFGVDFVTLDSGYIGVSPGRGCVLAHVVDPNMFRSRSIKRVVCHVDVCSLFWHML